MQDSARVATDSRPVLEQAVAAHLTALAAAASPAAIEAFVCVSCDRLLPAQRIAFDTDPQHYLGVCFECEDEFVEAQERPAPVGLVAAAADDGRYSLMGREVL